MNPLHLPALVLVRLFFRNRTHAVNSLKRLPTLATALVVSLSVGSFATFAAEGKSARPNILFIITDDQSPLDLQTYNPSSQLQTPNIDRLAREGMVFHDAYHMGAFIGAVCTPSRHMIKCGRTLWHLPIAPEANKYCPPNLEQNTIAAVFNRAGYDTMRTGKPGNSYEAAKNLFTVRKDSVGRSGVAPEGSAWHADRVLEYLEQRAAADDRDPFLIYFGFSHPHDPRNGTPEFLAKYGATNHDDPNALPAANAKQPPLPLNYLPKHPFNTTLQSDQRDETQVSGVWKNRDERTIRNELGRYFACSDNIDRQIGRVLKKLEAMGELDNTYIFYTSDHGIAIGRHGLQGKQNLYQHSWRVPFIVKGPGIKPGSRVSGNIYLLDCLATLCEIANITPPETNEGISFKPILDGQRESIRDVLYGVHCGGTKPGMRCVKKGDWKLIKYDGDQGAVRETQLFNLAENPDELVQQHHDPQVAALTGSTPAKHQLNLASDPRYADKLKEMEALLLAEMRRLHDPWRLWNQPADGLTPPPDPPAAKKAANKKKT
jgi:choline-sulfatase